MRQLMFTGLTLLLLCGCGEPSKFAKVTGTVTIDGQPAEKGGITFIPMDGMSPMTGAEIVDGTYSSDAPIGESKVEIRVPKVVGKQKLYDTPDSPEQEVLAEVLPAKYNDQSELIFTATPGENEKNWELKTE